MMAVELLHFSLFNPPRPANTAHIYDDRAGNNDACDSNCL